MELRKGQIWREVHERRNRYVRVIEVGFLNALVRTCDENGMCRKGAPTTQSSLMRFDGRNRNFEFVGRAT